MLGRLLLNFNDLLKVGMRVRDDSRVDLRVLIFPERVRSQTHRRNEYIEI